MFLSQTDLHDLFLFARCQRGRNNQSMMPMLSLRQHCRSAKGGDCGDDPCTTEAHTRLAYLEMIDAMEVALHGR